MFPKVDLDNIFKEIDEQNEFEYNNTAFLYDFEANDFVYRNGNPVPVEGVMALRMWIEKGIRTRIYNYKIYENMGDDGYLKAREYGSNIINLIRGKKLPGLVVKAEAQRDMEEMVSRNPFIKRIENFDIVSGAETGKSWEAIISFDVITVFEGDDSKFRMEVGI